VKNSEVPSNHRWSIKQGSARGNTLTRGRVKSGSSGVGVSTTRDCRKTPSMDLLEGVVRHMNAKTNENNLLMLSVLRIHEFLPY
jgi:hypothetical protein